MHFSLTPDFGVAAEFSRESHICIYARVALCETMMAASSGTEKKTVIQCSQVSCWATFSRPVGIHMVTVIQRSGITVYSQSQ
jgi:hypothetical protein